MPEFQRHILVIDDNVAIHADFQKILGAPGGGGAAAAAQDEVGALAAAFFGEGRPAPKPRLSWKISTANQGEAGLAVVEEALAAGCPVHVAFVDVRMPPGWDGIETIERLWKADPNLQTVICSAYSDYSWDDVRARLGDSDRLLILKKPFDTAEIAQFAAALSEKYRLAEAAALQRDQLEAIISSRTGELRRSNAQLQQEVEQRRAIEERLRHDAFHDRLTGLPNRAMLIDRIEQCIRLRARDPNYRFALLFIDLDDFKVVNDSLGHEAGDQLLVGIGQRLAGAVRAVDLAGRPTEGVASRLGGDEFVLLLGGLQEDRDAAAVAERVVSLMADPFVLAGREVVVNLSIGVALGRSEYGQASDVLRDADTAVYRAKQDGKHRLAVFDARMHADVRERLELEADLRKAIAAGQFFLQYQPVVSLSTADIVGFEALLRWNHPTRGLIGPTRFIPVAEATGLIAPIGLEVVRQAARQVRSWRARLAAHPRYADLWVSVNLSGRQLTADLPQRVLDLVRGHELDPRALKLEITETVLMQRQDAGFAALSGLGRWFELALDDFGTGYSSLANLHAMPVSFLKIDRGFVAELGVHGRPFAATVQAIIQLARNCGKTVVAEGVESFEQVVQLQAFGCDLAQGYWFSPPLDADRAEDLLTENLRGSPWRAHVQELSQSSRAPWLSSVMTAS